MKQFLEKYSNVTHSIFAAWAFLVGAYAGSPAFHDGVNAAALSLYHSLPPSTAKVVSVLFGLVVSFYAWYRNGQKSMTLTATVQPGETGVAAVSATADSSTSGKVVTMPIFAALLLSCVVLGTVGCTGQQTAAELMQAVATAVSSLLTIEGKSADATKVLQDTQLAETAVLNWKSGTPASDVVEALNLVQDDLNVIPVNTTDEALINLAIGTVEEVITIFNPSATATAAPTAAAAHAATIGGSPLIPHRTVALAKPIKNKKDFQAAWNAALPASLAAAKQ